MARGRRTFGKNRKKTVAVPPAGVVPLHKLPALWQKRFRDLGELARRRRLTACLVGGCVRDLLLRKKPLDWDVVVEGASAGLVREAARLFGAGITQHAAFLTSTLHFHDGTHLDVATARRETYPEPAELPVVEPATLREDFLRRDFSVNAMAAHLNPDRWGRLEDPTGGREDCRRGVVRVLHLKSFTDDPTRIYRAARYAGRYGWKLEWETEGLLRAALREDMPRRLTPARLKMELERLLQEEDPRAALKRLTQWGAAEAWGPDWRWNPFWMRGFAPRRRKFADGGVTDEKWLFRWMVLCHGLPPDVARRDLLRLEVPRATVERIVQALLLLKKLGMDDSAPPPSARLGDAARRFLVCALGNDRRLKRWEAASPRLNGNDLRKLGYEPGPHFQMIFESIRRARWQGKIRTQQDEIRHVIDNFPRKN